jgi:hypothetical protein
MAGTAIAAIAPPRREEKSAKAYAKGLITLPAAKLQVWD